MSLSFYNSLSKQKEVFTPINQEKITMYVCGPTVYDHIHIGNARSAVVYDLLYRLLRYIYPNVLYVRNITDVDDKIIMRAQELNISIQELTSTTTEAFLVNMEYLNCLEPTVQPKATEHISDMIHIIQRLLQNGHAYCAGNDVYFSVSSFKDYTSLSGRSLTQMLTNTRCEQEQNKKHQADFVLWKGCAKPGAQRAQAGVMHEPYHAQNDQYTEPPKDLRVEEAAQFLSELEPRHYSTEESASFESPWGLGRPGWHIECSAMSYKYLGHSFDIHGGGVDLIFPHHTNEIAQSKCAFKDASFARYWIHNGFVMVNGEKMSKSLNNFITVKDLRDQGACGNVLRLALLATHYHKPMNFNKKLLEDAKKTLDYCYKALSITDVRDGNDTCIPNPQNYLLPPEVMQSLSDDLNTPQTITHMYSYAKKMRSAKNGQEQEKYAQYLLSTMQILGLTIYSPLSDANAHANAKRQPHLALVGKGASDERCKWMCKVYAMVIARKFAKLRKNWAEADDIRQQLLVEGVILTDDVNGKTHISFNF
ncbi:Cysteine--tRNA ligase [Rickettsiales endosymbiont of Paramecium tredecaurelia]|uniref:cysteine--tRNA ligase n=1 Tax=Candidatus Sarmatiella mevalonica TaxID=2770581 RepID=UPI0019216155|nr:cysteine--tRNA ligase [Candidatus Sarmatiella mevalonica]MBL3285231.1 Cysteine--tRNA ligase [Candidatus Sarmatiella mevalonica]